MPDTDVLNYLHTFQEDVVSDGSARPNPSWPHWPKHNPWDPAHAKAEGA